MLLDLIKTRIEEHGPLSVADYMAIALSHPEHGYYMRKDPFGVQGDFITAPEVSQIFGELTGLWLAQQWIRMGKPKAIFAELGPGRGTLMADILRATKTVAGFHESVSVRLVETSPLLKNKQWQTLANAHPRLEWCDRFDELPELPLLLIANEFFDALPIRQYLHDGIWKERMVTIGSDGNLQFIHADSPPPPPVPLPSTDNIIVEYCPAAEQITRAISAHIHRHGGAALLIDYGYSGGTRGDTLQAVKAHQYHEVLQEPGMADLTAHVDFDALKRAAAAEKSAAYGPVPQGLFLRQLGAAARAIKLCENGTEEQKSTVVWGMERLLSPDQMGDLFKVLCIVPPDHPKPEGF